MIGLAVFFIIHERLEVLKIGEQLLQSNIWYILLGIIMTGAFLLLQAKMYVHSFLSVEERLPLPAALRLFLKRNLVSIFLPAGGLSSLAFFSKEPGNHNISATKTHLASTLFGFVSILSVVLVAIPVMGIAFLLNGLRKPELLGFVFLMILTLGLSVILYSISKKGRAYQFLARIRPSMATFMDEIVSQKIVRKHFVLILFYSTLIEIVGIMHLYTAMLALGYDPSWPAAIIGYVVMIILLLASPFLRGLGAIEVSLTFILSQFGFPLIAATSVVLLYRFFMFWLPLLAGIVSFIPIRYRLFPGVIRLAEKQKA